MLFLIWWSVVWWLFVWWDGVFYCYVLLVECGGWRIDLSDGYLCLEVVRVFWIVICV